MFHCEWNAGCCFTYILPVTRIIVEMQGIDFVVFSTLDDPVSLFCLGDWCVWLVTPLRFHYILVDNFLTAVTERFQEFQGVSSSTTCGCLGASARVGAGPGAARHAWEGDTPVYNGPIVGSIVQLLSSARPNPHEPPVNATGLGGMLKEVGVGAL